MTSIFQPVSTRHLDLTAKEQYKRRSKRGKRPARFHPFEGCGMDTLFRELLMYSWATNVQLGDLEMGAFLPTSFDHRLALARE